MYIAITQIKKKAVPILKKAGVKRSALFGSVVHGKATKKSDIDMLVDFPRGKSLFDLVGLQFDLQDVLGKKVDLVTYNSIYPRLKERILKEQRRIL